MLELIGAIVALVVWFATTFAPFPLGLGLTHVFLAAGAVLFIRWWALRDRGERPPSR